MDYSLKTGDELVLIAEDSAGTVAKKKPCYKKKHQPPQSPVVFQTEPTILPRSQEQAPENILMLGWNNLSGMILLELDKEVQRARQ
jgi:hypothetical protein